MNSRSSIPPCVYVATTCLLEGHRNGGPGSVSSGSGFILPGHVMIEEFSHSVLLRGVLGTSRHGNLRSGYGSGTPTTDSSGRNAFKQRSSRGTTRRGGSMVEGRDLTEACFQAAR